MMTEKQSKIHSLGPKKLSSTGKAFYQTAGHNSFLVNKPFLPVTTVPQPQIRYLLVQHPQFETLVKQLTALRGKYAQLLVKFEQKNTQESLRANIQEVIESTHNIEAKMSRIVEDANNMDSKEQEKENQPVQYSSKYNQIALAQQKARHQKQCFEIIQTVNKATQKIQELQQKNTKLTKEIQGQKQWKEALQTENKRLRLMLQNIESQKQEDIERLQNELKELREKSQQKTEIHQNNLQMPKKKIDNSHYLAESQMDEGNGFSKLTINMGGSRLSKVYE